jgi:hypothetical protein
LEDPGLGSLVVWGAGRLFDSLVVQGELPPTRLAGLVDSHLPRYLDRVHGIPVVPPEEIARIRPDTVVIMSRAFAGEIQSSLRQIAPHARALRFSELMSRAQNETPPSPEHRAASN